MISILAMMIISCAGVKIKDKATLEQKPRKCQAPGEVMEESRQAIKMADKELKQVNKEFQIQKGSFACIKPLLVNYQMLISGQEQQIEIAKHFFKNKSWFTEALVCLEKAPAVFKSALAVPLVELGVRFGFHKLIEHGCYYMEIYPQAGVYATNDEPLFMSDKICDYLGL